MPFQLPDPRRVAVPEATSNDDDSLLTDEEVRLLSDPAFVEAFIAWRDAR